MVLCHARALAHTSIYRASNPLAVYPKAGDVPPEDAAAEDWECVPPPPPEPTEAVEDCGCGQSVVEGEQDAGDE